MRDNLVKACNAAAWRQVDPPDILTGIASMLIPEERKMLYTLARDFYHGWGSIIDAGCFLGGSTLSICKGLYDNPSRKSFKKPNVHSYDLFKVEPWAVGKEWKTSPEFRPIIDKYGERVGGDSTRDLFDMQIESVKNWVDVHEGDIMEAAIPEGPIEILFVDIMKSADLCDYVIDNFYRRMVPEKSILIHQDYLFKRSNYWIHITMEVLRDYFTRIGNCNGNSVVYLYSKEIPAEMDLTSVYRSLSLDERTQLMDKAIATWEGRHADLLREAKQEMTDRESARPSSRYPA